MVHLAGLGCLQEQMLAPVYWQVTVVVGLVVG
jgi:hypothetical protein